MQFTILDVGHRFSALAIAKNGAAILLDCGHKAEPEHRPSRFLESLGISDLSHFFITSFHEDRISDLVELGNTLDLSRTYYHCNEEVTAEAIASMQSGSSAPSPAMSEAIRIREQISRQEVHPPQTPGISWQTFANKASDFTDNDNLSMVVALKVGGLTALVPGNLRTAGWQSLLQRPDFRESLALVNIFIASRNGSESGYCADLFKYCKPSVVVIPNSLSKHGTPEMTSIYETHAGGISFNGWTRKSLETRSDGQVTWG